MTMTLKDIHNYHCWFQSVTHNLMNWGSSNPPPRCHVMSNCCGGIKLSEQLRMKMSRTSAHHHGQVDKFMHGHCISFNNGTSQDWRNNCFSNIRVARGDHSCRLLCVIIGSEQWAGAAQIIIGESLIATNSSLQACEFCYTGEISSS